MSYWQSVPGWFDFPQIYSAAVQYAPPSATLVEIGVFMGRSACFLMEEMAKVPYKGLKFYAIDWWTIPTEDNKGGSMDWPGGRVTWKDENGKSQLFEMATDFLRKSPAAHHLTEMINGDSAASARRFNDESVWFAFIDASHAYIDAKRDLASWWPKIQVGGCMAGHDWTNPDVEKAVREFAQFYGVTGLSVLGNCWMIKKQAFVLNPSTLPTRHEVLGFS